ncbi:hypothetical protein [Actinomadura roseirufa]|uniref:hypothetical protein n=1 Tax=Actinomadura roseirufa TaxID=2094049 RepID=UPI00104106D0|nr:hypothetical protein [Actinomadura roseirufa]
MNATAAAHLARLAGELRDRGWEAEVRGRRGRAPVLRVRNPRAPRFNDEVLADGATFTWDRGQEIAPLTDTPGAADHIENVLREQEAE